MKLLIITQTVDKNHPILGFFCRWVKEFAKHFEHVHVIALQQGKSDLPGNVTVYSLGKEQKHTNANATTDTMIYHSKTTMINHNGFGERVAYVGRFLKLAWRLRRQYDAVFVHMNPEYIVLAGWWWRLIGKKVGLWYTHKSVDLKLRIAEFFTDIIFTASKESFRLPSKKVQVMGHGIDTDFFKPDAAVKRGAHLLSVGRLMPSKRHDLAIHTAHDAGVSLRVAGDGPERERLEALAQELGADVMFLGPLSQEKLRDEYRAAAKFIHRSETGSLDKVVLEAAACGCPVDTSNTALAALPLSPEYVREHHSLQKLIPHILSLYT